MINHRETSHEPRTFEQIVLDDFDGNLSECMRHFHIPEEWQARFRGFMRKEYSYEAAKHLLRRIAALMGADQRTLFPPDGYLHRIFDSTEDTPAFKLLQKRYGLGWWSKDHEGINELFLKKGLSRTNCSLFCNICVGTLALKLHKKFCERVCNTLDIPMNDAFPLHMYEDHHNLRAQSEHVRLIADYPSATARLMTVAEQPHVDLQALRQSVVRKLLRTITPRNREIIESYFGFGQESSTMEEIGKKLGVTKANISAIIGRVLNRLRCETALLETERVIFNTALRKDDRVRI